jgi:hypothetical protein
MNANKSVFVHQAGASGKYMLRPVVHAYDKMMTGSITGVLTDAAGKGLGGVEVFAQTVGAGGATYANSAVTQSSGAYAIGLLPVDRTYHVACQPVTYGDTTTSYGPKASPGIAINSTTPVVTWNASFTAVAETGSVAGSVTSASTPPIDLTGTMVQARFPFDLGGTPGTPSPVTYAFDFLPVSSLYTMVAELPADPTAGTPARFSPPAPATVTTGATATVDLTIP